MSKPWHEKPLWEKVFMSGDRVYLHAGKIIGHLGIDPFGYYDAAKLLPDYDKLRYENAVRDLTVYTSREASPPRYELHASAKKVLWIIIGPPPDHPEYVKWWRGRLISVELAKQEGQPVEWADVPPVPLRDEKPAEVPPKKKPARKRAAKG
jgi:hypothetical protein